MKRVMTLPNILSSLRIFLVPFVFLFILNCTPARYPWLVGIFAAAIMLDFLDGYVARRFAMESELGKILDPLADKLLTFFSVIALSIVTDFPLWITIPIITRDLVILLASTVLYKKKHLLKGSIALGKITFFLIGLLIYIYIIDLSTIVDLLILKHFFAPISLGFVMWSFDEYFLVYQRVKEMANKKILIVDDDNDVRDMLETYLQDLGYQVSATRSGSEALVHIQAEVPHLLISDLLLPGEHGLDLIREVNKKWFVPIIVLSGVYQRLEVKQLIQEENVAAFFEKPVNLTQLKHKISQILNE